MRFTGFYILICGLLLALLLSSCSRHNALPSAPIHGFRADRAEFNLGDAARFEFKVDRIASDGQSHLLVSYAKRDRANGKKLGEFFAISTAGGKSFGPERPVPGAALGWTEFAFYKGGLAAVYLTSQDRDYASREYGDLFYTRSETDGAIWSEPVQINDEPRGARLFGGGLFSFIQSSENEIDCLWTDSRRGFLLTFFSASHDGGRTWTPNQAVEYDFREGEQLNPQLVVGAEDRLLALWQDGRDRQTLFDIRCSYSDDGGQHWSASQKVNDDQEHVWQTQARAVARGDQIYVVFSDFRESGEEGSNDWNIYFASSPDNGRTWKKNIRLNDVQPGVDDLAFLAIDERGTLYCLWRSGRESIFGDIYFAYSANGGESWSQSVKVNEGDELLYRQPEEYLVAVSGGKLLCAWLETRPGWQEDRLAWLEPLSAPASVEAPTPALEIERRAPPALPQGEALFADDFSSVNQARWEVVSGVWSVIDGAFMGVEPGASAPFSSFARFNEPESYLLRGRFKLDPVHHQMAYLYFRANPASGKHYVINNGFQTGVCLSIKQDDSPPLVLGSFALDGRPLAQRRFPFQNNRWYEFILVVRPERVDYFVDGRWMLSYKARLELPPRRLGVGGFGSAPTYFDPLSVFSLQPTDD